MTQRTKLSPVDAAWFRMDEPANLMMITGVIEFDAPVDWDKLTEVVAERLIERYPKFSQRIRPGSLVTRAAWEDDPDFELSDHLPRVRLADPGDRHALETLVSELLSTPLDLESSPWQLHLIDGYGDGCAVLARLHHSIADGIALASVLLSLTDSPDAPLGVTPAPVRHRGGPLAPLRAVWAVLHGLLTFLRLLTLTPDPATVFRGPLQPIKRAAWSEPIPLDDVKRVARANGGTVNDLLMAVAAGAIHRYLAAHGQPTPDVRVMVPVDLRRGAPVPRDLGNRFGLVFLPLPTGVADPRQRLRAVQRSMTRLKKTDEPAVTFAVLELLGLLPTAVEKLAIRIFGAKGTAVMTNVPGPPGELTLAGSRVSGIQFWVPQAGRVGLGVSILSVSGAVTIGVASDVSLVPDPQEIVDGFLAEYAVLAATD